MTVQNPAIFLQGGSHPAEDVRRWMSTLVEDTEGVLGFTHLQVSEKSGTPDMSVDVAGGRAYIQGTEATYQGLYFVENRGTTNLSVTAADGTYERHDLVVAKVEDSSYSGGTDAWSLAVVAGTPAASPSDPTAPANSITLARINVTAGATSITDAMIDDLRASAAPATVRVRTSTTRPLSPSEGEVVVETDTDIIRVYDGSNWKVAADYGVGQPPIGSVLPYAGSSAPTGYLLANGQAVSRTTYSTLFGIIGTTYGVGDGSTTFNIPDLRGRVPGMIGSGSFTTLGTTGGSESSTALLAHTHSATLTLSGATAASNGSHSHTVADLHTKTGTISTSNVVAGGSGGVIFFDTASGAPSTSSDGAHTHTVSGSATGTTGSSGSGSSFSLLQPFIALNFIVRAA